MEQDTIEVVRLSTFDTHTEVYARAWRDGEPLGFGEDGSVETERFRFFNITPSVSIADILRRTTLTVGKVGTHIVKGSIGNTTDTFFPSSDDSVYATSTVYATARGASTGTLRGGIDQTVQNTLTGSDYYVERAFQNFDTSALPDGDTVTSATLAVIAKGVNGTGTYAMYGSTASDTIVATDFDLVDSTANSNAQSGAASGTITFTLNATGIAAISKTGISKFSIRHVGGDVGNVAPSVVNSTGWYTVEQGGSEPVLTVVHASANNSRFLAFM